MVAFATQGQDTAWALRLALVERSADATHIDDDPAKNIALPVVDDSPPDEVSICLKCISVDGREKPPAEGEQN